MPDTRALHTLTGPGLRDLFAAAAAWLEQHKEQVNAINVFPVPDGDTGTNMYLTMRSTMDEAIKCDDESAGGMMAAMSHGALMGARGNSGVILSQILRGVARSMADVTQLDAQGLADSLEEGSKAAYQAVTKPVEGTILTVVREAAEGAAAAVKAGEQDITDVLDAAVQAARESVERTPELLPALKEAGVVDAGGEGLYVLLEGMLRYCRGEETEVAVQTGAIEQQWLSVVEQRHADEASPYGYCAEVLVEGENMDIDSTRDKVLALGDSVLCVGDETLIRIHVHTDDPGAVLTHGTSIGQLAQVKIDNINRQAEQFVEMHHLDAPASAVLKPAGAVAFVAVAPGPGLAEVFRSTGVDQIVSGGPTMNPSARELLDAVEACSSNDVVVLPNDKNIILAATQAAEMSGKRVRVVESRSVPQGLAALLAVNPDEGIEDVVAAMEEAIPAVRTVEITHAVRSTTVGGVKVEVGQVIAVVDDELRLAAETPEEATVQALRDLATAGTSLISLYYGADTTPEQAAALAETLGSEFTDHEVEVVAGGQPHYLYIVSLE